MSAKKKVGSIAHTRWMIRSDTPSVLAIDAASGVRPLTEARLETICRKHDVIGLVIEHPETYAIVGYVLYRRARGHLTIGRLVVHPDYRRQGFGSAFLAKLKGKLQGNPEGRCALLANVRETDLGAQLFLKAAGLTAYRTERGHYRDTGEDAYVFTFVDPVAAQGLCLGR